MTALNIVIFVIVYGRIIEIYLMTSLAPIPLATVVNREIGSMGQNYFRSLLAVGFQGLLIIVCVAIYAVLIQGIATGGDMIARYGAVWAIPSCSALRSLRRAPSQNPSSALIDKAELRAKLARGFRNEVRLWPRDGTE